MDIPSTNIPATPANNAPEQRTLDWHRQRLGVFTASEIGNLKGKGKLKDDPWTETAKTYLYGKMAERMLDPAMVADDERFADYLWRTDSETRAMRYGTEHEAEARTAYELKTGNSVAEGGFVVATEFPLVAKDGSVETADISFIAASPDGRIGADGLLEIKCPAAASFARYCNCVHDGETLLSEKPLYYWQVQCQLLCTNTQWCDWCAYSADCGGDLLIVRIERDDALIEEMVKKAILADRFVNDAIARHRGAN